MKTRVSWPWVVGLSLVTLALVGVVIFTKPTPRTCGPRTDDPQGYLFKICTYIQEKQLDVSPADPTGYHIKQIEERQENGRAVVWVFLNCCYLGDIAIIDKASGEVIRFRVGAK
jgi:hypothetical protein